ncbi:hypothetical protein BBF96_11955 [Anoxybacter fermentans]|uniref:Radical SAM core domain-containing protein n=1 Tax=Anoxybacter fermentans TaxID=1323375 RepID=A0A3Q9HRE3_9FIRM|nr:hypothetical protein BBF96_11955 [Anoxybacter fermentans]
MDELEILLNKYGDNYNLHEVVNFCDLNFINTSSNGIKWVRDFVDEMLKRQIFCFFYILTRVDSVVNNKDLVKSLRQVGLVQVEMGLEVYNKGIEINQSYEAINFLRKQRIDITPCGFVTYHPYSNISELRNNAEFLKNKFL